MAYPFESSIVLTNAACNLIFASETSYITESSSGQLDIYAGNTNVMIITSSSMTLTTGAFIDTIDEYTTDAGVTVEGVLFKDSDITLPVGKAIYFGSANNYIHEDVSTLVMYSTSAAEVIGATSFVAAYGVAGGTIEKRIILDGTQMRVQDDQDSVGFVYHDDYSAIGSLNDRWIPDWEAVTGYVTDEAYVHPNHSGHITSVADGATTIQPEAIDDQTSATWNELLFALDEILVHDTSASALTKVRITDIAAWMASWSTDVPGIGSIVAAGEVAVWANTGAIGSDSGFTWTNGDTLTVEDKIHINDANTVITEDVSGNLSFTDAVTGTKTLAELVSSGGDVSWGTPTNPYVALGDSVSGNISSSSSLKYEYNILELRESSSGCSISLQEDGGSYWGYTHQFSDNTGYFAYGSTVTIAMSTTGAIRFWQYGDGTFTGTAAYALQIDTSGNIIEGSLSAINADTITEYTGSAGVTIESTIYATGLGDDDTEDHIVAIDDSTGLLTKRAVSSLPSGSGDVSWGTASNSYIVYGSSGGDIQSTSDFNYNPTTNKVQINGGASDGGKLTLTYNTGDNLILTTTSTYGQLTGDNHILFTPGTGSGIGFGAGVVATNYITIRDSDGTYGTTNILDIQSSAGSSLFEFRVDGSLYFTTLGSDDTEDHVLAIDDSTGLVTKRAVSTLAGSGDVSWGTATNKYLVFGSASGDIQSDSSLVYDTSASELTIGPATGFTQIGITSGLVMGGSTTSDYYRFYESAGLLRIDWDDNDAFSTFDSIVSISQALELIDLRWDVCITSGNTLTFDGQSGDSYIYDNAGDLTFRDASNTGGVTLSTLTSGILEVGLSGEIPYTNSTPDDFDYSSNFKYSAGILTLSNITMAAAAGTTNYGLVLGAVTTGAMSVQANLEYSTTDEALYIGGRTSLYTNWGTTNLVLGNTTSGDKANIEFVGNQSTDTNIGSMTWHNSTSGETYNRLAQFSVYRDGDNDAGAFVWHTATAAGTLVQRMELDSSGLLNLATTATALTGGLLNVASSAMTYAGTFFSDGNSASYKGIKIQAGADSAQSPSGPPGSSTFVDMYDGNGTQLGYIYGDAGGVYLQSVSDKRLKTNISKLSRNAEEIIMGVEVAEFNWKHSPDAAKITGYVAQDVAEIFPEMMHHDIETDLYTVSPAKLIPYMHKVIQNQNHRIDELEKLINKL